VRQLVIDDRLFFDIDHIHQSIVHATAGARTRDAVLTYDDRAFRWDLDTGADTLDAGADRVLAAAATFALVGALLLLGPLRWRGPMHGVRDSVALVAALAAGTAVGLQFAVSERVAALALAAAIVYVAAENVLAPTTRGREVLTGAFGVVHGMWLAGGARPPGAMWMVGATFMTALAGTIVVVLSYLLDDQLGAATYRRYGVPVLSAAAGVYAIAWMIQRA
jgi:hypothetical protein